MGSSSLPRDPSKYLPDNKRGGAESPSWLCSIYLTGSAAMLVAVAPYTHLSAFLYRAVYMTGLHPNQWQMSAISAAIQVFLLVGIITLWEKRPLASIGAIYPASNELRWGVIAFALIETGNIFWAKATIPQSIARSAQHQLAGFVMQSAGWRVIVAISASFFEECFFRGYAIERAEELTGSMAFGAIFGTAVDLYLHAVGRGASMVMYYAFSQFCLALLYLWRRNLTPCIVAHFLMDVLP